MVTCCKAHPNFGCRHVDRRSWLQQCSISTNVVALLVHQEVSFESHKGYFIHHVSLLLCCFYHSAVTCFFAASSIRCWETFFIFIGELRTSAFVDRTVCVMVYEYFMILYHLVPGEFGYWTGYLVRRRGRSSIFLSGAGFWIRPRNGLLCVEWNVKPY